MISFIRNKCQGKEAEEFINKKKTRTHVKISDEEYS